MAVFLGILYSYYFFSLLKGRIGNNSGEMTTAALTFLYEFSMLLFIIYHIKNQ